MSPMSGTFLSPKICKILTPQKMSCKCLFTVKQVPSLLSIHSSRFASTVIVKNAKNEMKNAMVFTDASLIFGHKTTRELLRGFFVLHACSIDSFVNRSHYLMKIVERVFGSKALRLAVAPFYNQFVAGDCEESITKVNQNLASVSINLMIAPMLETDLGELMDRRQLFETNFRKTLFLIEVSSRHRPLSDCRPICQTKITAHISAECLLRISTLYEALSRLERQEAVEQLCSAMVSKTRIFKLKHLKIDDRDLYELRDAFIRLYEIGKLSMNKNVILAVDAEYSYVNPAINLITLAMMKTFNKDKPVIWNTYQGYLKNSKYWLENDFNLATSLGIKFGAKIVRGAYLEKERANAVLYGTPDPVYETYEATNASYNSLLDFYLPIVASEPRSYHVVVATHNEFSVVYSTKLMKKLDISPEIPSLVFAQIYGMAENISVTLAKHGYNVYKSVPYGSINETLPYLSRRANENRVVFHGARQERTLLAKELRNRLWA